MSQIPDRQALQPERTALAWQRTALTATVLSLPLILVAGRVGAWWLMAGCSGAAMVGALLLMRVRQRFEELRGDTLAPSPFPLILRVAVVAGLAAAAGAATGLYIFAVRHR